MLTLNYRDTKPIYIQIKSGLKKLMITGAIAADEKLPSVRELAGTLAINPNTIQRAYRELEAEGYLYSVSGKGTFAAKDIRLDETGMEELFLQFEEIAEELLYFSVTAEYLKTQGYEILEKNYRCRIGEIDLIAKEGETLVFVEVKYRRNDKMGDPKEAVNRKKQKKISMTASYYLMRECGRMDIPCRFDVAAVLGEQIEVVKNAFEYLP